MTDELHTRLISALVHGYLWVAAADGQISEKEIGTFHEALQRAGYGGMIATIDENELQHVFKDTKDHFSKDFDDAVSKTKIIFEAFKGSSAVEQIIKVSRKAVVADERLEVQEEAALKQIAEFLGWSNP